ncbi:MAG TPA: ABC transporter ATP-binding protein [Conexibacter sp.]|jgi:branched-chain amino acid transport system ATP-binding protein
MSRPLLDVDRLDVSYGAAQALFGVTFAVAPGERLAILGNNGFGKTTLARTIAGLMAPVAGRIALDGEEIAALPAHRVAAAGIGLVPQGRHVFASLTVEENLRVAATEPEHHRRWREVYTLFPRLEERRGQRASSLSGGEQQMLAIGRALVRRPRLLVLDEPTEGLAPRVVEQLCDALRELVAGEQLALLLMEQRIAFAEALCDRVVEMDGRGRLAGSR